MIKHVALSILILLLGTIPERVLAAKASRCDEKQLCHDSQLAADVINLLDPTEQSFAIASVNHPTRAITVAANELLWQRAREKTSDVEVRATAAALLIDTYLNTGLSDDAIKLYEALDAETRERVSSGPIAFGMADVSPSEDFFVDESPTLTAAGLASAYAEAGRLGDADKLLDLASKPTSMPGEHQSIRTDRAQIAAACVRTLIHADERTDWFAWVFQDEEHTHAVIGCPGVVAARAYQRRAAQRLDSSGLPEAWRSGVEPNERPGAHSGGQDKLDAALKKLPKQNARIEQLTAALAAIDREDERWIAWQRQRDDRQSHRHESTTQDEPSPRDHALANVLAERLARPAFNPYRIEQTNAKASIAKPAQSKRCAHGVIRCLDVGQLRWELLMSQDYDPSGEVPAAGYWLRRTELPTGQPQSFYLGIKEHMPFELVDSDQAFVVDGELRLLVRRAAIDPDKITFPPVGLDIRGEKTVLLLRAKLDDVTKDSDEDGLTDLAEQQLLLDPQNPDSDGDGIPDGKDSLPDVALSAEPSVRQRAFAAALAFLTHEPDLAISIGVPGTDAFVRRRASDERTLFVTADPEDVAGISAGRRIIVLPTSLDFELLRKHAAFGVFYPMSISLRMIDDKHAELRYSASWHGGTLVMELHDGVWRIGTLSSWIT